MTKTHYDANGTALCGRGKRITDNVFRVDCGLCQYRDEYRDVLRMAQAAREAAFNAQEPRTIVPQFGRVNDDGVMECYSCHGVLFRERPRSLFSYHYVCAACGTSSHPMTETGMST